MPTQQSFTKLHLSTWNVSRLKWKLLKLHCWLCNLYQCYFMCIMYFTWLNCTNVCLSFRRNLQCKQQSGMHSITFLQCLLRQWLMLQLHWQYDLKCTIRLCMSCGIFSKSLQPNRPKLLRVSFGILGNLHHSQSRCRLIISLYY